MNYLYLKYNISKSKFDEIKFYDSFDINEFDNITRKSNTKYLYIRNDICNVNRLYEDDNRMEAYIKCIRVDELYNYVHSDKNLHIIFDQATKLINRIKFINELIF